MESTIEKKRNYHRDYCMRNSNGKNVTNRIGSHDFKWQREKKWRNKQKRILTSTFFILYIIRSMDF